LRIIAFRRARDADACGACRREGVWLVQGGMHRLAELLSNLAQERGVTFHYGRRAERILVENGRTCGLATEDGELFAATPLS